METSNSYIPQRREEEKERKRENNACHINYEELLLRTIEVVKGASKLLKNIYGEMGIRIVGHLLPCFVMKKRGREK